jgi:hypothetical protein
MREITLPRPNEQRKVEKLLAKLITMTPLSAKPAPISYGVYLLKTA